MWWQRKIDNKNNNQEKLSKRERHTRTVGAGTLRGAEVLQTRGADGEALGGSQRERDPGHRSGPAEPERSNGSSSFWAGGETAGLLEREPGPDTAKSQALIGAQSAKCVSIGAEPQIPATAVELRAGSTFDTQFSFFHQPTSQHFQSRLCSSGKPRARLSTRRLRSQRNQQLILLLAARLPQCYFPSANGSSRGWKGWVVWNTAGAAAAAGGTKSSSTFTRVFRVFCSFRLCN
ncbi:hypothetical protein QBC40DRAFT_345270 [Triangularia verruculosa]|uniref:Uncharacterized protein n=1 Tax=Triangularia verruculosa TaxID=2587418 RepID=A0AAN7AXB1_9PEZI|nr:hypothetical protein QBC40DRAFT_345270 [Triangularia verruculosa]